MYISSKDWAAFVKKLSALNQKAADSVVNYVAHNGFGDTNALIGFCYSMVNKYGGASASLAAAMYDKIAELEHISVPSAELASAATYSDVAEVINGTLKMSQNPNSIGASVGRLVKQAGQDTLLQNSVRDGAEAAWIPSGDACAFCIMLASRGWERVSMSALNGGHAEHIHANCNCTYMVRHTRSVNVRGYDPDACLAEYEDASSGGWKDKLNAMRRERYAENADEINAQKREAYAVKMHPKGTDE